MKIKTSLPKNLKNEHKYIFLRREFYRLPKLVVKTKKNVFLTHYGILLKNFLVVKHSLPNAWGFKKPNSGFIFEYYRKAIEIFLVCKFGKSLSSINLNKQKNYLFV